MRTEEIEMQHSSDPMAAMTEARTIRKVGWRLMPFLMLCYLISYIDRVNVGFAALDMRDIGISEAVFGFGGTLFFIAYVIFEIPSNAILQRVGARLWIARIMISWGLMGMASALVVGPWSFYASRFLLGAAEAGFFPGVILYLNFWFPRAYRARIVAIFMVAIPLSNFLGSPMSAFLLRMDGFQGLAGWQWLFILESIPAVILGLMAFRVLTRAPNDADWLTETERSWLVDALARETRPHPAASPARSSLLALMRNREVLALAVIYCGSSATSNALSLWQPQILKSFHLTNLQTGFLNMIPFGIASIFMVLWARRADVVDERVRSTAIPLGVTALCLFLTLAVDSLPLTLTLLTFALVGNYALKGPFWALATETIPPSLTASGVAAINAIAHLGTGGASALIGLLKEQSGSFSVALIPLEALTAAGAIMVLLMGRRGAPLHPRAT